MAVADHRIPKKVAVNKQLYLPQRTSKNAYIVFKEARSVERAVSLNGNLVQGHHIRVDRADTGSVQYPPDRTVFVGNLPFGGLRARASPVCLTRLACVSKPNPCSPLLTLAHPFSPVCRPVHCCTLARR